MLLSVIKFDNTRTWKVVNWQIMGWSFNNSPLTTAQPYHGYHGLSYFRFMLFMSNPSVRRGDLYPWLYKASVLWLQKKTTPWLTALEEELIKQKEIQRGHTVGSIVRSCCFLEENNNLIWIRYNWQVRVSRFRESWWDLVRWHVAESSVEKTGSIIRMYA